MINLAIMANSGATISMDAMAQTNNYLTIIKSFSEQIIAEHQDQQNSLDTDSRLTIEDYERAQKRVVPLMQLDNTFESTDQMNVFVTWPTNVDWVGWTEGQKHDFLICAEMQLYMQTLLSYK